MTCLHLYYIYLITCTCTIPTILDAAGVDALYCTVLYSSCTVQYERRIIQYRTLHTALYSKIHRTCPDHHQNHCCARRMNTSASIVQLVSSAFIWRCGNSIPCMARSTVQYSIHYVLASRVLVESCVTVDRLDSSSERERRCHEKIHGNSNPKLWEDKMVADLNIYLVSLNFFIEQIRAIYSKKGQPEIVVVMCATVVVDDSQKSSS
jgi:hypothetical protein